MMRVKVALLAGCLALAMVLPASAQDASELGKSLTPFGAIKAGNADGTIPAWTGGLTTPPPGYDPKRQHIDPFADEQPLFVITAQNMDQYADKLPEANKALFKAYPKTYRMPVYRTHRTAAAPQRIYDATIANATRAKLADGGNGVAGAKEGIPFPIPTEGVQVVWNHILRWRGVNITRQVGQANPLADGTYTMIYIDEKAKYLYSRPEGADGNTHIWFLQEVTAPSRLAGEILLVHDTINQVAEKRSAWTYNPGQRRVRRAPNVQYDNPGTASDGQRTNDQLDMFNGSPDRYEWTLIGRKEMYVPYNSYKLHSDSLQYKDIIQAGHINQDHTRYELHRVWVVEGKVRQGTSHQYATRRFYVDEDSWQVVVSDQYDARGQMWRPGEAHSIQYYNLPGFSTTLECFNDLLTGRYTCNGFDNQERPYDFETELTAQDFSPDGLRRAGVR